MRFLRTGYCDLTMPVHVTAAYIPQSDSSRRQLDQIGYEFTSTFHLNIYKRVMIEKLIINTTITLCIWCNSGGILSRESSITVQVVALFWKHPCLGYCNIMVLKRYYEVNCKLTEVLQIKRLHTCFLANCVYKIFAEISISGDPVSVCVASK